MGRKRNKGRSWHLFWRVPDDETLKQLELFVKLSVVRGIHHTKILAELVAGYNTKFLEEHQLSGVTLADEKGLMDHLRQTTPVSRVLLSQYRSGNKLVPRGGTPLFWTDGRRIVYNLEGCKAFFSERRAA